jgi:Barrel-sandwich domain of CusB or HlyD membrane-fusion
MKLSPFVDTQLTVQIDERNLGLLLVGQKALASADAYPKDVFEAEVIYINPGVDVARASVEVKLRVLTPPAYLRQDMTVSVEIETARHPGALIVPAESLRGLSRDHPWVMKVKGRHNERQPVSVGRIGGGKVEILGGLKEGDLLIPSTVSVKGCQDQGPQVSGGHTMNQWAPFEWITALRFLKEGRMQTVFIIAAVGIGVAVIVFMSAMLSSLQSNFLKRVLTSQPHIQLIPPDEVARQLRHSGDGQ